MKRSTDHSERAGLSLEYRLPLLITTLLVATLAVGVAFAYAEVKATAVQVARQRLQLVSEQLAGLVRSSLATRAEVIAEVAEEPAIVAYLAGAADSAGRAAALTATEELRTATAQTDGPVALLTPQRSAVLVLEGLPGEADGEVAPAPVLETIPDTGSVSPFFPAGGGRSAHFWRLAPVERGGETIGYLAEMRPVGGPGTAEGVRTLIGRDVDVFFANAGSDVWVTLEGEVEPAPSGWPFVGATEYDHGADGIHFGHAAPVAATPWAMVTDQPMDVVLGRPRDFLRRSLTAAVLMSLVAALAAWLVSRGITRPVGELRHAAEAIARGEYSRRIDLRRTDEFGILANSFNWMSAQVESAVREADEARHEAEEANRAKSEFLATMSHEIRTPINAILGYGDLLELGIAGPLNPDQLTHLERIRVSGRHLTGLVDQVLDFARIESGTLRLDRRTASATEAVETALTVVAPQAEAKGVVVSTECIDDAELRYLGDPHRVDQILVNLLSNAVKFTEPGGSVRLLCAPADGRGGVHFEITDTGVGIAPEQLDHIFEPFVQLESGYTRRHQGTGLGLAISLRLAESMGGTLSVESEVAKGSRFTLWLPGE